MRNRTYESTEAFYAEEPARIHSGEVDFGVHWHDAAATIWPTYRLSWVRDTGEFYAECLAGPRRGQVELLGRVLTRAAADATLEGWAHQDSMLLDWARARISSSSGPERVKASAEELEVDSDEDGFHLIVRDSNGQEYDFHIQGAYEFAGSPGLRALLDWRIEGESVRAALRELPTGAEGEGYDLDDPKHPGYREHMAEGADLARKAERERS